MTYEEAVEYIEDIPKFTKKTALAHTERLLDALDHPERGMKILHVAGTNGKGSVCAYLRAMLQEGGYRTGFFTSPHLVRINERFQIGLEPVDDEAFVRAFSTVRQAVERRMAEGDEHPTYFETLFLMALVLFREAAADYVILEVGMGGRLDATNVISRPLVSVITSISLDHTEYLGDTVTAIAGEKAGIIKPGVPVVYDGHDPEAAAVIRRRAAELGSPAFALLPSMTELIRTTAEGITFRFLPPAGMSPEGEGQILQIPQAAPYQMMNASLAWYAMSLLREEHGISAGKMAEGISRMQWPCRMETVMKDVIVDGAHNPDGVAEFVRTAAHFHAEREITILFSAVADKHYAEMIRTIAEGIRPERVVTTSIQGSRQVSAEKLAGLFEEAGVQEVFSVPSVGPAFDIACALKGEGMLFCVGSLYMAGEIKAWLGRDRKDEGVSDAGF